jgi:hypothetical protein
MRTLLMRSNNRCRKEALYRVQIIVTGIVESGGALVRILMLLQLILGFAVVSHSGQAAPLSPGEAPFSPGALVEAVAGRQYSLLAIDGTGDKVTIDFNAPLNKVVAALLRTSSYEWPHKEFERMVKRHGKAAVRREVLENLDAIFVSSVRAAHEEAMHDPLSPLNDLFKRKR